MNVRLSIRELATVLAALRERQRLLLGQEPAEEAINAIASDGDEFEPLTPAEIDDLCERLNCSQHDEQP